MAYLEEHIAHHRRQAGERPTLGQEWHEERAVKYQRFLDALAASEARAEALKSPPEDVLERMARAFISSWFETEPEVLNAILCAEDLGSIVPAMRAALSAAEERGEQASTSPPSEGLR